MQALPRARTAAPAARAQLTTSWWNRHGLASWGSWYKNFPKSVQPFTASWQYCTAVHVQDEFDELTSGPLQAAPRSDFQEASYSLIADASHDLNL